MQIANYLSRVFQRMYTPATTARRAEKSTRFTVTLVVQYRRQNTNCTISMLQYQRHNSDGKVPTAQYRRSNTDDTTNDSKKQKKTCFFAAAGPPEGHNEERRRGASQEDQTCGGPQSHHRADRGQAESQAHTAGGQGTGKKTCVRFHAVFLGLVSCLPSDNMRRTIFSLGDSQKHP